MSALETLRQAASLVRSDRSDEEVERLTGATLGEIIEIRARVATEGRAAARRDRFSGRRFWGGCE